MNWRGFFKDVSERLPTQSVAGAGLGVAVDTLVESAALDLVGQGLRAYLFRQGLRAFQSCFDDGRQTDGRAGLFFSNNDWKG